MKMMLQKKLNASWIAKSRSPRVRSGDAGCRIDSGGADAHEQEQNAPDNGKDDGRRRKRRLPDHFTVNLRTIPGEKAGKRPYCLHAHNPERICFP